MYGVIIKSLMSLGERLKGTDVHHAGIATHFVASKEVEFYHSL